MSSSEQLERSTRSSREKLLALLGGHAEFLASLIHTEEEVVKGLLLDRARLTQELFIALLQEHPDCSERTCLPGHLTASALVISPCGGKTALIKHKKLQKWFQPGGHADGSFDLLAVALREVREELNLACQPIFTTPFDLDIHEIPANHSVPQHLHYDLSYLLRAESEEFQINPQELDDAGWYTLTEARKLTDDASLQRMFELWSKLPR